MTAAQARLAGTIDTFYGAADRQSDGAMAGHAYKRSVEMVRASNLSTEETSLELSIRWTIYSVEWQAWRAQTTANASHNR